MRRLQLFFLFFFLTACGISYAAADPVTVKSETSKAEVTIGELIECRIIIRHAKEAEILGGITEPEARGMELKSSKDWHDKEGKMTVLGRTFQFTAFQLGNYVIGPVDVSYRYKNGPVKKLKTNPLYITVKSVAEGEEKSDIRDVKGVVKLPYAVKKYLIISGILFFLGLLAVYLIFLRKHDALKPQDPDAHLTPSEAALRDLHELFESTLMRDGQVKQYYLRFSEILRIFLEKQFGIAAAEATTSEIEYILLKKINTIPDEQKRKLLETLKSADFAKFAKWVPAPADVLALNKQAEEVVKDLTPVDGGANAVS